ncbi:MAG TPA: hypothetical protein VNU97_06320 [Rhizomicrobium sp.]|jgi:hypothetical protein|nr:hypothetical protein [Rhizomicrobium sp.]
MAEPLSPPPRDRDGARRKAQNHFAAAEARDSHIKQIMAGERAALDAKTLKLRALRLAKEEADKLEAARVAASTPSGEPKKKKAVVARKKVAAAT